jgi:hypothetical protein
MVLFVVTILGQVAWLLGGNGEGNFEKKLGFVLFLVLDSTTKNW